MPISMALAGADSGLEAAPTPFPARTRQAAGLVGGVHTEISSVRFVDKILVTAAQEGKLAHWVHVPLAIANPIANQTSVPTFSSDDDSYLLPSPHLTATTLLGGGAQQRDTLGRLCASQVATALLSRAPQENRLLVVGMGLKKAQFEPEDYLELIDLVMKCL